MQRVALACEPKLLVADEPTTSLDVSIQDQILALLDDPRWPLGMALLLITHGMGVISRMADRVLVMYAGQVVEATPPRRCSGKPGTPTRGRRSTRSRCSTRTGPSQLFSIPGEPPDPTNNERPPL